MQPLNLKTEDKRKLPVSVSTNEKTFRHPTLLLLASSVPPPLICEDLWFPTRNLDRKSARHPFATLKGNAGLSAYLLATELKSFSLRIHRFIAEGTRMIFSSQ